jgi:hypothetical protein
VQEPGVYFALLEAIAGGAVRVHEIAAKTGEPAAKCIKYMEVLHGLGFAREREALWRKRKAAGARSISSAIRCVLFGIGMLRRIRLCWKQVQRLWCGIVW